MSKKSRMGKSKSREMYRMKALKNRQRRVARHLRKNPNDYQTKNSLKAGLNIRSGRKSRNGFVIDAKIRLSQHKNGKVIGRTSSGVKHFLRLHSKLNKAIAKWGNQTQYQFLNIDPPSKTGYAG